jgi:predicted RNA methylase/ferredoxin-fold anticodon binding domain-containing protein
MSTVALVSDLKAAGQDFEWYPTTRRMVDAVIRDIKSQDDRVSSVLDIGAGDGRVLTQMAETFDTAKLYSIERSTVLQQRQPDVIIPVGAEFYEQDLMSLPVDVTFSNPPYSEYEEWASRVISTVHASTLYLVIPQRWDESKLIAGALAARGVKATVIHTDGFFDGERAARATVDVIRIAFADRSYRWGRSETPDPFDAWFDANIDTFDKAKDPADDSQTEAGLARINKLGTIADMVAAFNDDYARMESNYKAIFQLDAGLLKELGVDKTSVREGLKKRMKGLKNTYWEALFRKLDVITSRLTTKTKNSFLQRLTGQTSIAFTESNAYAVVLWAIKAANHYFDVQVVEVFRALSTHDGVSNYKSNTKTWEQNGWRYNAENHTHYTLDYRIVKHHYAAIHKSDTFGAYDYPGNLHKSCHELVDDLVAVFSNLGFRVQDTHTWNRRWSGNEWQDFKNAAGDTVFQAKAFMNGNMHFRIMPDAIKSLNIEAGRLLGWLQTPADVVRELGYSEDDATRFFGMNQKLGATNIKFLAA